MDKKEVRKLFPNCCAVADKYRDVFGKEVKLVYVAEGGKEMGKRSEGVVTAFSGDVSIVRTQAKEK